MDFDIVVVGSGAGGGTVGYALAKAGRKVLIVEKGLELSNTLEMQDERRMILDGVALSDRQVEVNGNSSRLFVSGVAGGGTAIYGATLLRPSRDDFHPGKYYADYLPRHLWDWPICYDDLEPYYAQAEDLYKVSVDPSAQYPHIESTKTQSARATPPYEPINIHLNERLRSQGLQPFHLPLAIDFNTCLRCPTCPGFGCPNSSRSSSLNRCVHSALTDYGAEFWTGYYVDRLKTNGSGKVTGIELIHRRTGQAELVTANTFVIAGGAIETPLLLMRSDIKDKSDQIGRNYMYHAGVLAGGIFAKPTGGDKRFIKQLGWTDDYFGTPDFPHKLGYVQTIPIPGPLTLQKEAPIRIPLSCARMIYSRTVTFAAAVEDLPQPQNRVQISHNGQASLTHKFHRYDLFRSRYMFKRVRKLLSRSGALVTFGATVEKDELHTAHQVGTCRFGNDPKTSVINRECKLHGFDNVYIADGSFMPTSLGVGPALTIMANALRVADIIINDN